MTELKCYGKEEEADIVEEGITKKIKIDGPCITKHGGKTADAKGDEHFLLLFLIIYKLLARVHYSYLHRRGQVTWPCPYP